MLWGFSWCSWSTEMMSLKGQMKILHLPPHCIRSQEASDISAPLPLPPPLSVTSALSLSLLSRASLAAHGVAALLVPLHVTDAPHGLELRVTGTVLIEVPVFPLLQQVLAATVTGELVSHPAEARGEQSVYNF